MRIAPMTLRQVADLVGATIEGDETVEIRGLASLEEAGADELTFAADDRRAATVAERRPGAAIVAREPASAPIPLLRVDNVQAALARLLAHLATEDLPAAGIDESARVSPQAEVAPDAAVGPLVVIGPQAKVGSGTALCANVVIGAEVQIGERCVLGEGVVVRAGCQVGNRVRIGPNSVIGYDGFGYYSEGGVHHRIPHAGNVVIGDDVEIGACSCVDRAKFGSTRIEAGTKIDNLVQVAHNVQVGPGCILVGQCGIAGSSKLGGHVVIGGHSGIRDNITLGDGAQVAAYSGVASDVDAGVTVAGTPAGPAAETIRIAMAGKKLPELLKRVKTLESRLKALESSEDN
jgi:UDP-3-O-[3-hydroxymyristoyl] glucosamine N-acyltransferase